MSCHALNTLNGSLNSLPWPYWMTDNPKCLENICIVVVDDHSLIKLIWMILRWRLFDKICAFRETILAREYSSNSWFCLPANFGFLPFPHSFLSVFNSSSYQGANITRKWLQRVVIIIGTIFAQECSLPRHLTAVLSSLLMISAIFCGKCDDYIQREKHRFFNHAFLFPMLALHLSLQDDVLMVH